MKKMIAGILTVTCLLFIGSVAFANEAKDITKDKKSNIGIEIQYFMPKLEFKAKSNNISYNGGNVDFKNDLGMVAKNAPGIRLTFGDNVRLDYMQMGLSSNKALTQKLEYEGKTYQVGANASSDLDMTYIRATWLRPISKSDSMETHWMIDLKGFSFKTKVSGTESLTGLSISQSKKFQGIVPTVGFAVNSNLNKEGTVQGFAEISGLPLGKYGNFYDASAGLSYKSGKGMTIKAGYRVFDLDVKNPNKDESGQFKMAGPFFALEARF